MCQRRGKQRYRYYVIYEQAHQCASSVVDSDWTIWKLLYEQGSGEVKSNFNLIKYHQTRWNNIKSSSKAVPVRRSVDNILSREKIENFKLLAEALYLYLRLKANIIIGWDLKECELIHLNDQNNIEIWH